MARLPTPKIVEVEIVSTDDIEERFDTFTAMLAIAVKRRYEAERRCQDDTQKEDSDVCRES